MPFSLLIFTFIAMAAKNYSKHQIDIISGYYNNLDSIMLQKISELVTELYLTGSPAKKDRLWERVHKAMLKLKIQPQIISHIMQKKNVEILAKNLQDWLANKKGNQNTK